jgi:hypothetical protein
MAPIGPPPVQHLRLLHGGVRRTNRLSTSCRRPNAAGSRLAPSAVPKASLKPPFIAGAASLGRYMLNGDRTTGLEKLSGSGDTLRCLRAQGGVSSICKPYSAPTWAVLQEDRRAKATLASIVASARYRCTVCRQTGTGSRARLIGWEDLLIAQVIKQYAPRAVTGAIPDPAPTFTPLATRGDTAQARNHITPGIELTRRMALSAQRPGRAAQCLRNVVGRLRSGPTLSFPCASRPAAF